MQLSQPTVGPIVGYTSEAESRIWLRGDLKLDDGQPRRCFGAVRYRKPGAKQWSDPIFNKLEPHFDMTGVFALKGLARNTPYEYQAGWFFAESELTDVARMDGALFQWPDARVFNSGSQAANHARSYIVGSCRYVLRLFGGAIFDSRGDKCFRSILSQIDDAKQPQPVDALLMIGDQIYADDKSFLDPASAIDDFLDRYRTAFSQDSIRELMSRVPTYMILDDHEIENNWPSNASPSDRINLYPHAIHAYQIYQCSHSPLFESNAEGRIEGTPTHFWYTFQDGCVDWFVMDVRTERITTPTANRRMIKDDQMKALLDWLSDGSGRNKFIVTSVPFIPDMKSDRNDKWDGFVPDRDRILQHIEKNSIRRVAFVSGDVHCSFTCQLQLSPTLKISQIVSSSFYWPYPHMEENQFDFSGFQTAGPGNYQIKRTSPVYSDDNFARMEASPGTVNITYFGRKGDKLGKTITLAL